MRYFLLVLGMVMSLTASAATQTAIFAGGCFWCMQSDFDKLKGVAKTTVGYDGGTSANPTYEKVSSGTTKYVESIKVEYNPKVISYTQLVDYFWLHIDPTVENAQFCDHGDQYRSEIFYLTDQQKQIAEASLEKVKKLFPDVYTELAPSTHFYDAEDYHQNYYKKNPVRYKYYRWSCGRDKRVAEIWKNKEIK